jgi:hypothetical protein
MASVRPILAPSDGSRRIRWPYALFVTTLAVFLASLPLIGLRHARYEATTIVGGPGAAATRAAEVSSAGISREDIAAVAVKLQGSASEGVPSPELAKRLEGAIRVDYMGAGVPVGASGLALYLVWNNGSAAVAGVNELAHRIVDRENARQSKALVDARRGAREQRDRWKAEREDLHGRLVPLRAQIAIEKAQGARSGDPRKSQPDRALPNARPRGETATQVEMRDELVRLESQRNRLLERFTSAHPDVRFLSSRISELQNQLKQAPANGAVQDAPRPAPQEKPEPNRIDDNGVLAQSEAALVRQLEECDVKLREANLRVDAAERAIAEFEERPAWQHRPATMYVRLREEPDVTRLALTWLTAVVAGVLVAFSLVGLRPKVESLWDARATLDVPIVGAIPAASDAPARGAPTSRIWAGRATKLAELSLMAMALLIVTTACVDYEFALHLADDPVDAWSSMISRLRQ